MRKMTQKCLRAEEQAGISDAVARWRSRGFCGHVFSKLTRFYHRKMNKMTGRLVKDLCGVFLQGQLTNQER